MIGLEMGWAITRPAGRQGHHILKHKLTHVFSLEARADWTDRRSHLYDQVLYRSQQQAMRRLRHDARRCHVIIFLNIHYQDA
jgi:uncharacterized protein YbjQ (UPF0145 family)